MANDSDAPEKSMSTEPLPLKRPFFAEVRNVGEPIRLTGVNFIGMSGKISEDGKKVEVVSRLSLTSDDPFFHVVADNFTSSISYLCHQAGHYPAIEQANHILLVIHKDESAELWVDTAAMSLDIFINVEGERPSGSVLFKNEIADVVGVDFPCVSLSPDDKILVLFREAWRFGLYFDFEPDPINSRKSSRSALGAIFRSIRYRAIYDVLIKEASFNRMVKDGWFPFVELTSGLFNTLARSYSDDISIQSAEQDLLQKFDNDRLEKIYRRWLLKPVLKEREIIIRSAIDGFKRGDSVSCIKILLTEIEGILSDNHYSRTGSRVKIRELIDAATKEMTQKVGTEDSLFFISAFTKYLRDYTFSNFDPASPDSKKAAGSRHAVGHGAVSASSYTQVRALQALLTLDQISFYL